MILVFIFSILVAATKESPTIEKYELKSSLAKAFLNSISHRQQKRDVYEECHERGGCNFEEVKEVFHPSRVCAVMERIKCSMICHGHVYYGCKPKNYGFCGHIRDVKVECIEKDACASNPCHNSGTCVKMMNSFRCNCPPKFFGHLCDRSK